MLCMLRSLPDPEIGSNSLRPSFDPSAVWFVSHLRGAGFRGPWSADEIWELYADYFGEGASHADQPLTRGQLFRRIGFEGLRRYREPTGKRRYRYSLTHLRPNLGRMPDGPPSVLATSEDRACQNACQRVTKRNHPRLAPKAV
jgi:hypothetical protein